VGREGIENGSPTPISAAFAFPQIPEHSTREMSPVQYLSNARVSFPSRETGNLQRVREPAQNIDCKTKCGQQRAIIQEEGKLLRRRETTKAIAVTFPHSLSPSLHPQL